MATRPLSGRLKFAAELIAKSAFRPTLGTQHKPLAAEPGELGVTFIGHASFLLQLGGLNLLIDPVFAHWLVLVHRLRRPGVRIKDLPPIDAILLTHAHMDHLNIPSLRKVTRRTVAQVGKPPVVIVPKNVEDLVSDIGFSEIRSLDWWHSTDFGGIDITMTPAQHWGTRVLHDNYRGYGGYVLRHGSHSIFHCGDTGYFRGFEEIRRRLSPHVALLPIGAYSPAGFTSVHMTPEDAVQAFLDLGARNLVPMHYGTFSLSKEPMDEPLQRLFAAAKQAGISAAVDALGEGETRVYSGDRCGSGFGPGYR